MNDLNDKIFLIIGGLDAVARGVGETLAEHGAQVLFAHPATHSPTGDWPELYALDWLDPGHLTDQIAALGPLDGVIFCPGWHEFGLFLDTTPADWDAALIHNYEGILWVAQSAARQMIARGQGGRLIFLSSVASLMPFGEMSVAGTTLTALWALVKMIAVDLGVYGITANVVATGWVEREWAEPYLQQDRAYITADIPLGRIGTPADVGEVVCFLSSASAAYITGAVIPVDGGYVLTRAGGSSAFPPGE